MKYLLTTIQTIRQWIILAVIFLFPIFFLPITPDFYSTNKLYLLVVATLILGILWVIQALIHGKITLTITNSTKGLLILAGALTITTILGAANKIEALVTPLGLLLFVFGFFFVLFAHTGEKEKLQWIQPALLVSFVFLALATIYHAIGITAPLVGKFPFFRDPLWSPSGNTLTAVVMLVVSIPLFLEIIAGLLKEKHAKDRAIHLVLPVGGFLIVAATLLGAYQILAKRPILAPSIVTTIQVTTNTWRQTKRALFGTGFASYMAAFAAGKPASINQTPAWTTYFGSGTGLFAHIATTAGIVGLLGLVIAWASPLAFLKNKGERLWIPKHPGLFTSYALATIAALVVPPTLPLVMLWLVLLLLLDQYQEATPIVYPLTTSISKGVFGIISLCIILLLFYLGTRSYAAYLWLYQSFKAVDARDGTGAYQWAVRSLNYNPLLPSTHLYFSQINLELASSLATKPKVTEEDRNNIAALISQAIREAKNAITIDPTNPIGWINVAKIYETLIPITNGADQWAIASYQQAAIFDPINPLVRFALGSVSVTQKNYDAAITYFTQAALLKPDFANAYYNLANAYKLKGDSANQTAMLQKTLSLVARDTSDYTKVTNELQELDRQKAASASAQPSQSTSPQPSLSTPPSGKPIIVPPIPLPASATSPATTKP